MVALIIAPAQYVRLRMRRYSPDYEFYARSSAAVGHRGVLLTIRDDRCRPRESRNLSLCLRRKRTAAVGAASDQHLRHAGAGGPLSRAISNRISLNIWRDRGWVSIRSPGGGLDFRPDGGLPSSGCGLVFPIIQYIAAQASLFEGVNLTPEYRLEIAMKVTKGAVGQEDCSWLGVRFHQCGRVYCVTPDVVGKFLLADNPCYHTTCVNADADIPARQSKLTGAILVRAIWSRIEGSVTCVGCVSAGLMW